MMRAVVNRVESRGFVLKIASESIVNPVYHVLRKIAARNAGLSFYGEVTPPVVPLRRT